MVKHQDKVRGYCERLLQDAIAGKDSSLKELRSNAEAGDPESQYYLAQYYAKTTGSEQNDDYLYWLRKSTANGFKIGSNESSSTAVSEESGNPLKELEVSENSGSTFASDTINNNPKTKITEHHYANSAHENDVLRVSGVGLYHMQGAAKWINLIATVMAIVLGLMALAALYVTVKLHIGTGLGCLIILLIFFLYPLLKSFGIASHFKRALALTDSDELELGLSDLRSLFTFYGVLIIIALVLIAIFFITVIGTLGRLSGSL